MAGYIRQSSFIDGDTITAALFNNEYNQLVNAFSNTSGHKHDGTTAEGPVIGLIGDAGETSPNNKVLIDTTNNYIEFYVEVASAPVQQLYIADGAIIPVTDSDIDLGTTSLRFKDTYTDTVTTTGNVSIGGDLTVIGSATISGNLTFGDADTDSINLAAEIDSHIVPNTDNTYDLGTTTKEWRNLYIDGTANIDSLVADTADINGGTIDGATIATSDITVGAGKTLNVSAGTLTLADNQISGDKVEGGTIAATTITTLTSTTGNITNVNATTVDSTNLEVTNLKAKDGTTAGSIANTTGVVTLGSSVLTTTDINGGTIDGVTIGGTTAGAVTFTDLSDGTITIAGFADEDNMVSNSATLLPTQQSVKAYVDSQVTAQDLDFQGDTGGALSIDLDSESLTIAGGTGLDTVGSGNTVTINIDSTVATLTGSQTLTNKTIDVDNNTVSNIEVDNLKSGVLDTDLTTVAVTDTTLASAKAIKTYVDAQVTAQDLDFQGDTGGALSIDLDSESLTIAGGTGIDTSGATNTLTVAIDSTVATLTGTQTLTNKTLTTPIISSISNTGTLTLPTSTDTLVGRATTDTLTNKTLTSATLTSPVLNTSVSGTAFLDDDTFATATASTLASSESIKAYVDTEVGAIVTDVVSDTTPQLGGDLASNGNDILFADNDKAIFGAGSDLQIYHDGSNSRIQEGGTGSLLVRGTNLQLQDSDGYDYLTCTDGGNGGTVALKHLGTTVLNTTTDGIDVTGTVNSMTIAASGFTCPTNQNFIINSPNGLRINIDSNNTGTAENFVVGHNETSTGSSTILFKITESGTTTLNGPFNLNFEKQLTAGIPTNNISVIDTTSLAAGVGGAINFSGVYQTGGGTTAFASIEASKETATHNEYGGALVFKTRQDQGSQNEHMRITSTGNVGIGTSSPSNILKIFNTANSDGVNVENTNASFSESGLFVNNTASTGGNLLRLRSSGSDKVVVLGTGNVGIGVTNPSDYYSTDLVVSSANEQGITLAATSTSDANYLMFADGTSGDARFVGHVGYDHSADNLFLRSGGLVSFKTGGGTERMRIDSSGNVGIGTTSPDTKLHINGAANSEQVIITGNGNSGRGLSILTAATGGQQDATVIYNAQDTENVAYPMHIFQTGASEKLRINGTGEVHITSGGAAIDPTIKHGGATGDVAKLRLINRSGQGADKGGLLELGAVTDDGVTRSDVLGSVAGLKSNGTSGNRAGYLQFSTNNGITLTEAMRITYDQKIGIGTTAPDGPLHIDAVTSDPLLTVHKNSTGASDAMRLQHGRALSGFTGKGINFLRNDGTSVGAVVLGFTSTQYQTSSDYRLKENVNYTWDATTKLKQLKPARFNFIEEPTIEVDGFLAHEVQDIVPQAVSGEKDAVDDEGNPDYQGIDHSKLVPLLVKTIQELEARITALES